MTSCLAQPPTTLDAWLATVDRCATQAGGPAWQQLAVIGLASLVVLAALALLVGAIAWGKGAVMGWIVDPRTREPLPALPSEPVHPTGRVNHWQMERDESGAVVRMRFRFCDDPRCCSPLPGMVPR